MPTMGRFDANDPAPSSTTKMRTRGVQPVKIDHAKAQFVIPQAGGVRVELGDELTVVLLGLVRERIMWVNRTIACRSHDTVVGLPQPAFPWQASVFAQVPSNSTLPCQDCEFKDVLNRDDLRCTQTWNVPFQVTTGVGRLLMPHRVYNFPFAGSAIGALKEYMDPFRVGNRPVYEVFTRIRLRKQSANGSTWAGVKFADMGETEASQHFTYSQNLAQAKAFFQPPVVGVPHASTDGAPLNFQPITRPGR